MTTETTKQASAIKPAKPPHRPIKKAQLSGMLSRQKGATMAQLEKALAWQPHTVRAAISGLRKSGMNVVLDRTGKTPTYKANSAFE